MTATDRETVARMDYLRELLKEFGATLRGYDPGIAAIHNGTRLDFEGAEWAWLEPLLVELRERRAHNACLADCYEGRTEE